MRRLRALYSSLSDLAARGLAWALCLGFTYEDARRLHSSAVAAIGEAQNSGQGDIRTLTQVVRAAVEPAVRNSSRWDWRKFLRRLIDVPLNAMMAALPLPLALGAVVAIYQQSVAIGGWAVWLLGIYGRGQLAVREYIKHHLNILVLRRSLWWARVGPWRRWS